jgi:hypothetical protein
VNRLVGLVLVAASACGSEAIATQTVQLASLSFDVPADWERHDADRRSVAISEWAPDDNARKQSITVIRSETSPAVAKVGVSALEPLLAASQRSLTKVRASKVKRVTTARGLTVARIELDFVPPGMSESYHRIHVVFVDGTGGLVHVLYTALKPDAQAFAVVLNSLRNEEA